MTHQAATFIKLLRNPWKFRMYLLSSLPSALFAGLRIRQIDEKSCAVSVPYKWFTKNPFRSTYFACLSMAAEMSTGALCLVHLYSRTPRVSMLVLKVESEYFKKATGQTTFTCEDGAAIRETIELAVQTGEGRTIVARSTGKNEKGETVAQFSVTWSFKSKNRTPSEKTFS